jgi:hypothetical protein
MTSEGLVDLEDSSDDASEGRNELPDRNLTGLRHEPIAAPGWKQSVEIGLVRAASHSIYARLRSIEWDARRALELCGAIGSALPVFGNARAGAWYVPHELDVVGHDAMQTSNVCCFKSADGHYGQWNASMRRPNIPLLRSAVNSGGAIVIDVTRAGKVYPDALSKTLPIWCAVVNAVGGLASCDRYADCLHLQPGVPPSERDAILNLLPGWVGTWKSSGLKLETLVPKFANRGLPLRPLWVRADANLLWEGGLPDAEQLGFIPIVCLSASPPIPNGVRAFIEPDFDGEHEQIVTGILFPERPTGFPYVQGAADDEDSWSVGLCPDLFWRNRDGIFQYWEGVIAAGVQNRTFTDLINELRLQVDHIGNEGGVQKLTEAEFAADVRGIDRRGLMFESRVGVRSCISKYMVSESNAASLSGAALVIALSSKPVVLSDDENAPHVGTSAYTIPPAPHSKIRWLSLANFRGKPDYKHGLCRVLGECLRLLCSALKITAPRGSENPYALVLCDSKCGDWAAGVAASWIAWHCDETMRLDHGGGRDAVDKRTIQNIVLRIHSDRPDLVISRRTQQQINRFFQSPAPPSSILESQSGA